MSSHQHAVNIENGNAGRNSSEHKARTNCCWGTVIGIVELIARVRRRIKREVELIKPLWPKESWKTFILWISLIIIDPLICYVPVINDKEKLLDFDRSFSAILLVLYVVIYVLKLLIYVYKIKKLDADAGSYSKLWWVIVVVAPLVPVFTNGLLLLILIVKPTTIVRASIFTIGTAIFLILYLGRVLGIYKLFIAAANPSDKKMKTAIFRILVNLLLYLYGGHLFGGLWYFFAVWKKMECWNQACVNRSDCYYDHHRFIVTSGDNRLLDNICFNKIDDQDTTYELGIFKDALQSRIVETSKIGKKLLYCFRWGAQNISGFGQNLEVSTHAWENIFVILLVIYGMATFTFFIGNMQNLIKSSTSKSEETRWTKEVLKKWSPFEKLSVELQIRVIKECEKFNDQQMGDVDVKNLLSNLPKDVQKDIKYDLCSKLLAKVEYFQSWDEAKLINLCDCVKPIVHTERARIVNEGDPMVEMWFVVQGEVWTYSSKVVSTNSTNYLEFWGEELFNWAQNESNMPISKRTMQALTKVEAFVLTANDFRKLCNAH